MPLKHILSGTFIEDDRLIAKEIMQEYQIDRDKAFDLALKYVWSFEKGVREGTYSIGD